MQGTERQIVINCSRLDREFAERLSVSLQARNVPTFLHHTDVPLKFTPQLIAPAFGSARHQLCVVSANSISDEWLRRQLSAATGSAGCSALIPVLIDDVEMPAAARQLSRADFRKWQHADAYYQAGLSEVLRAVRITAGSLIGCDVRWFVAYSAPLRRIESEFQFLAGQIFMGWLSRTDAHYMAVKWAIHDDNLPDLLRYLSSIIPSDARSTRLPALATAVGEALEHLDLSRVSDYRVEHHADQLRRLLQNVARVLEDLRADVELARMSPTNFDASQPVR